MPPLILLDPVGGVDGVCSAGYDLDCFVSCWRAGARQYHPAVRLICPAQALFFLLLLRCSEQELELECTNTQQSLN